MHTPAIILGPGSRKQDRKTTDAFWDEIILGIDDFSLLLVDFKRKGNLYFG